MALSCHDLLAIEDLEKADILTLIDTAVSFKDVSTRQIKKVPTLRGRTIVNFFLEPSTRTRTSFEIAGKRLSADVINISGSASSLVKGESLKDMARTIEAMQVDAVVVRHWSSGSAFKLAHYIEPPVINAGDGKHEHPTQALLDLLTIKESFGKIAGLKVTIVGDISHSRVARSLVVLLKTMGATVTIVAPPMLIPAEMEKLGCDISLSLDDVIEKSDILYILRIQKERLTSDLFSNYAEYNRQYGLTKERWAKASKKCKVMHPGPMNRGIEIDDEVADSLGSLVNAQVENGVAMRMAVLYLLVGGAAQELGGAREGAL